MCHYCPKKQTTEPKLLILVSFCSGEDTSSTDTIYCIHVLWEVYAFPFLLGRPVQCKYGLREHRNIKVVQDYCFVFVIMLYTHIQARLSQHPHSQLTY